MPHVLYQIITEKDNTLLKIQLNLMFVYCFTTRNILVKPISNVEEIIAIFNLYLPEVRYHKQFSYEVSYFCSDLF